MTCSSLIYDLSNQPKNVITLVKSSNSHGLSASYKASSLLWWYTNPVFAAILHQHPFQTSKYEKKRLHDSREQIHKLAI